jgi:hypothetical protein
VEKEFCISGTGYEPKNLFAGYQPDSPYFPPIRHVGQSFCFASELPLGPELALLPLNHRKFISKRAGQE